MKSLNERTRGISVIMPVHNGGSHLETSTQSILHQTHHDLELIIIDDHSTDDAIEKLNKNDSRLRIITNTGKGIVPALNTGIEKADKPFIARMDADDIALPNRLEEQLDYLLNNPDIQICGSQVELFCDKGELGDGYRHYQNWINALTEPDEIDKSIFIESPIPHPSAIMRKEHWLELGGYRDTDWPEDYDLWLKAYLNGFRFGKPEGILLRWRDHDRRLSRTSNRYNKKAFFKTKAYYLAQRYSEREFRIWGSGPTGALLHDEIINNGGEISDFIDIAQKRIGNTKRNKPIVDAYKLEKTNDLILIAVNARGAREDIRSFLDQHGFIEGIDYLCTA